MPKSAGYSLPLTKNLQNYGYPDTMQSERVAVELKTVRQQLKEKDFYSTLLNIRDYDGEKRTKKVTFSYLDSYHKTIIVAQSDMRKSETLFTNLLRSTPM